MIEESRLAQAIRHVAEGKAIVARQREIVARKKEIGADASLAESLLERFERTLAVFEQDLREIRRLDSSK